MMKARKISETKENEGISRKKLLLYIGIIVACFGSLYPRIIHPTLKGLFGISEPEKQFNIADVITELPPHMRDSGPRHPGAKGHMRPHPSAFTDNKQQNDNTNTRGSGGMMTVFLPIYAVGIVGYLIYTATKVYGKTESKKKKKSRHDDIYSIITERLAGINLEKVLSGEDKNGAEEINKLAEYLRSKHEFDADDIKINLQEVNSTSKSKTDQPPTHDQPEESPVRNNPSSSGDINNVSDLLKKCENNEAMTPDEITALQRRLLDVEGKMNKLMQSIQSVQKDSSRINDNIQVVLKGEKQSDVSHSRLEPESSDSDADSMCDGGDLEVEDIYAETESSEGEDEEVEDDESTPSEITLRKRKVALHNQ